MNIECTKDVALVNTVIAYIPIIALVVSGETLLGIQLLESSLGAYPELHLVQSFTVVAEVLAQTQPSSIVVQSDEQPSPFIVLPSSHFSFCIVISSPQTTSQTEVLPLPFL